MLFTIVYIYFGYLGTFKYPDGLFRIKVSRLSTWIADGLHTTPTN